MDAWVDRELGGEFPDLRLKARLGKILGDLGRRIGGTLPAACQDWAPAEVALTEAEIAILDRLTEDPSPATNPGVCHYLVAIAKLGGDLARAKDPPPGNMVIWRVLTRLMDIQFGFELSRRVVGN